MILFILLSLLAYGGAQFYYSNEQLMTPVTTEDGYILTLHRIPRGRSGTGGGRPILLQHGLLMSGFDSLTPKTNRSLSYSLADAGYDVWIGNNRGNIYSDSHIIYSNLEPRYWNFSWDEMSLYDYPTMINYVLNVTRQPNLYLVGYSQFSAPGGHTFFTATDAHPEIQAKVKHFFALAPSLSSLHLRSTLLQLIIHIPDIDEIALDVIPDQVFALPSLLPFCGTIDPVKAVSQVILDELTGPVDQIDDQARNGTKYFDYGAAGNLAAYGTTHAREFNFSGYSVPTSLYFSPSDKLVSTKDMNIALSRLLSSAIVKTRNLTSFGHLEFVWGNRAKAEIYDEIIADMNAIEKTSATDKEE